MDAMRQNDSMRSTVFVAVLESPGMRTREVEVCASSHRAAFALAREACVPGEFVRGVVESDSGERGES